jgi:hypothetical protein
MMVAVGEPEKSHIALCYVALVLLALVPLMTLIGSNHVH